MNERDMGAIIQLYSQSGWAVFGRRGGTQTVYSAHRFGLISFDEMTALQTWWEGLSERECLRIIAENELTFKREPG